MNSKMAFEWLKSAYYDLLVIEEIIHNELLTHVVAMHSQQAIEKSFKAVLEFEGRKIPKNHDLLKLKNDISSSIIIDNDDLLDTLNRLYIDARYPGDLGLLPNGKPSTAEAVEFRNLANTVYKKIENFLKGD